jgi:hypothetical protein
MDWTTKVTIPIGTEKFLFATRLRSVLMTNGSAIKRYKGLSPLKIPDLWAEGKIRHLLDTVP